MYTTMSIKTDQNIEYKGKSPDSTLLEKQKYDVEQKIRQMEYELSGLKKRMADLDTSVSIEKLCDNKTSIIQTDNPIHQYLASVCTLHDTNNTHTYDIQKDIGTITQNVGECSNIEHMYYVCDTCFAIGYTEDRGDADDFGEWDCDPAFIPAHLALDDAMLNINYLKDTKLDNGEDEVILEFIRTNEECALQWALSHMYR
jgi:hypothetical protein